MQRCPNNVVDLLAATPRNGKIRKIWQWNSCPMDWQPCGAPVEVEGAVGDTLEPGLRVDEPEARLQLALGAALVHQVHHQLLAVDGNLGGEGGRTLTWKRGSSRMNTYIRIR